MKVKMRGTAKKEDNLRDALWSTSGMLTERDQGWTIFIYAGFGFGISDAERNFKITAHNPGRLLSCFLSSPSSPSGPLQVDAISPAFSFTMRGIVFRSPPLLLESRLMSGNWQELESDGGKSNQLSRDYH